MGRRMTLKGQISLCLAAFFLALEPNHERVRGRFISNVLRAALPGGITDFLLVFLAQGFCFAFDLSSDYLGTISTIVVLTVGLMVLWGVCRPFNTWHWVLWQSSATAARCCWPPGWGWSSWIWAARWCWWPCLAWPGRRCLA